MTGSSSGERSASEAASLVFRIATVGLSLASAIMTATSTQCLYDDDGRPAGTVSYGDYPSFRYAAVADLLSAVLQGVAICLEVAGRKKAAKTVELIDKLVLALTSTSAALLLAVDEITSCGPPRARRGRKGRSACDQAGAFCRQVRVSSVLSLAGAVSVSVSIYTRRAPEGVPVVATAAPARRRFSPAPSPPILRRHDDELPPPSPPKSPDSQKTSPPKPTTNTSKPHPSSPSGCDGKPTCPPPLPLPPPTGCGTELALVPAVVPPWCRCPRLTIPCPCENPELCSVFF